MRRCIFHYPGEISKNPGVGSELRPTMMVDAFKKIGYEVIEITGTSSERLRQIEMVKSQIKQGVKYDFVYAENRNIPTMLSDDDHIPRHPFMDLNFFNFCKKNGVKVGLFYRDCHWAFEELSSAIPFAKRMILQFCFRFELAQYKKLIEKIYLPSAEMQKYVFQDTDIAVLPPGGASHGELASFKKGMQKDCLRLFYVGGVYGIYDITNLVKAVYNEEDVYLTICTVKEQWEDMAHIYEPYMTDRIQIIHKKSSELVEHYQNADASLFFVNSNEYANMAMPIKVFESISYGTPVIVSEGTAISNLIEKEDCGWIVANDSEQLKILFAELKKAPISISEKTAHTIKASEKHTWEARAKQVLEDLLK